MIPSETANSENATPFYDSDHNESLTSVTSHNNESDPLLLDPHMHPTAPSPPLALMEEDFDNLHHSHPELLHNGDGPSTAETDLMRDGSEEDDNMVLMGRGMFDEPDAKIPFNAIPFGPGSGILVTDEHNHQVYIPDVVNTYQQKKNLAQGMMDLALLSANANQLRYVLETFDRHPYNYVCLVLLSCSLLFQVAVGIGLIMNSQYNVTKEDHIHKADKINNYTVIGIFLVTVLNVFITSFGVADPYDSAKV